MELSQAYRPRRKTREEEGEEKDARLAKRKRNFERVVEDGTLAGSSQLRYSAAGSFGYQDYVHGKAPVIVTRTQLDNAAAERMRRIEAPPLEPATGHRVPSLSSICIRVFAENHDKPKVFEHLDDNHRLLVVPLIKAVLARTGETMIPFRMWMNLSAFFYLELPNSRKTYRGLCLEDKQEIGCLAGINDLAEKEWREAQNIISPPPPPSFFLAAVDLTGLSKFGDGDIWGLTEGLAPFLVVLKLDKTKVSDNGIASIVRTLGEEQHYERLEVLSLCNLVTVTDRSAKTIAKLPSLRMLGNSSFSSNLRGTSCTEQFRLIVNKIGRAMGETTTMWRRVSKRPDRPTDPDVEFALFGSSYSLSTIFTKLQSLAPSVSAFPAAKPILIHINSISRGQLPADPGIVTSKTMEELYRDQMALRYKDQGNVTYSRAYGNVTSTSRLSKGIMDLDAAEQDKGAAFRMQDDGVAAGAWVGERGKKTTLYEQGRRKFHTEHPDALDEEPISDRGEEGDEEEAALWEARKKKWEEHPTFYRGAAPDVRPARTVVLAPPSPLILLRHLPLRPVYERPALPFTSEIDLTPQDDRGSMGEGVELPSKKRRISVPTESAKEVHSKPTPAAIFSTRPKSAHIPASSSPFPSSSYPFPTPSSSRSSSSVPSKSSSYPSSSVSTRPSQTPLPATPRSSNPFAKAKLKPLHPATQLNSALSRAPPAKTFTMPKQSGFGLPAKKSSSMSTRKKS
ncbi:hypothetical protein P7C70_g6939, partial [Phenoliferia sp. Uapishka_3]